MNLNIIGIDASLSSSGLSICKVNFRKSDRDFLFNFLINEKNNKTEINKFKEIFDVIFSVEIKEDKSTSKDLAKTRKILRENPTLDFIILEEFLSTKKITDQTTQIMEIIKQYTQNDEKSIIFIEDYSYHSPGSLTQLAEMKGVLKCLMDIYLRENENIIGYITANINTVKKIGGRNGNANKELICEELKRFGFNFNVENDDEADSISVSLAAFYAIYHLLFPFVLPKHNNAKEKNYYKTFIKSLETFGERIGSAKDFQEYVC